MARAAMTAVQAEEKNLVIASQAAEIMPAVPEELMGMTGWEDVVKEDWVVPRLKIGQPTSKDGATAGALVMNLSKEEFSSLDIIIIKAAQSRVLLAQYGTVADKDAVLCRSFDFIRPDAGVENPVSPECIHVTEVPRGKGVARVIKEVCPKCKWTPDGRGGNKPPECNESWDLLCVTVDDLMPFWVSFNSAAYSPTKNFLSAIRVKGKMTFQMMTTLSTQEVVNQKGRFFVPKFAPPKMVPAEILPAVYEMAVNLKDVSIKKTIDSESVSEGDGEAPIDVGVGGEGASSQASMPEDMPDWMKQGV